MTFKPVIRKLPQNGRRKIVFRIQIKYINFPPKKSGGTARYVGLIGGLLLVVERSEEVAVLFAQGKIETYFLIKIRELSTVGVVGSFIFELFTIF